MTLDTAVLSPIVRERFASLHRLVGDTPMLEIRLRYRGRPLKVYAKHEVCNFTGSIKDRMALHIMESAYARGEVGEGDVIAEATSGNTGISFAAVGRALAHDVRLYMPDWMSRERVDVIRSLGATIEPVGADEGGFLGSIARADTFAADTPGVFRPQQFDSPTNVEAHRISTGPEIVTQLRAIDLSPTGFVAGVGTGGTVMGVGQYLRDELGDVAVHPLEPKNSPTLRTKKRVGKHRIQGVSDEFVPSIVDLDSLDEIVDVWDGDAILMAQRLASNLGLGVGISSGANLLGAVQVAAQQGDGAVVATVFPDSNKKYLSTDLLRDEPVRDDYMVRQIELDGCRTLRRPPPARP
jgi:cysteine synthase A